MLRLLLLIIVLTDYVVGYTILYMDSRQSLASCDNYNAI